MSALAVVRTAHAAYMYTDGAGLDRAGNLSATCSKAWSLPHLNLAVGFRGQLPVVSALMYYINTCFRSFDHARISVAEELRKFVTEKAMQAWRDQIGPGAEQFDIAFAGWSQATERPESFFFTNIDRGLPEAPPWTCIPWEGFGALPADEAMCSMVSEDFEPERDGIRIVEAQRKILEPFGVECTPTCVVGAFVQMTTVTKTEITSRIIHRWQCDRLGEKLGLGHSLPRASLDIQHFNSNVLPARIPEIQDRQL